MPIKTLEPYLFELKTVTNFPLEVLKNAVIGVDVEHYLARLLTPRKEPDLESIGGFPLTVRKIVSAELAAWQQLGIKPVFVFPGLQTELQHSYEKQPELLPRERAIRHAWEDELSKTTTSRRPESFRDAASGPAVRPLIPKLMQFFDEQGLEYIVAPYSALSQLHYMYQEHLIDCIFGSTDGLLLKGVDKVILSIDTDGDQFKFMDKSAILNKLGLTAKQFQDVSMCVGNGFQPFALNILPQLPGQSTFLSLHHFVLNGGSVYNSLLGLGDNNYSFDLYVKGCCALDFMPVMKQSGVVEPVQNHDHTSVLATPKGQPTPTSSSGSAGSDATASVPEEIHEFIGQRLPSELYFYQSVGITTFGLSETLIHNDAIERLPLDAAVTPLYEKIVTSDDSLELKGKALHILAGSLNRYYQFKKLKLVTYFNRPQEYDLDQKVTPPLYTTTLRKLLVRHATARGFDLNTLVIGLSNDYLAECTADTTKTITSGHELISTALLRALLVYGLIDEDYTLTAWGEAIPAVIAGSSHPEDLLRLLLFFKHSDLSKQDLLSPADLNTLNQEFKDPAILICKILAVLPVELNAVSYVNRLSRPLLQFHSAVSKVNLNLREMVDTNTVALLLANREDVDKFERNNREWRKIATELPFAPIPSDVLGIFGEQFFESYLEDFDTTKSLGAIDEKFKEVNDHAGEALVAGLKQFKEVVALVKYLGDKKLVATEVTALFSSAEALVDKVLS